MYIYICILYNAEHLYIIYIYINVQCERLFTFPCSGYPPPVRHVLPPRSDYVSGLNWCMQSLKAHIHTSM